MFNEAVCIAPSGRYVARYAKLHLFTPAVNPGIMFRARS